MEIPAFDAASIAKGLVCSIKIKNGRKLRRRISIARPIFAFACWIAGIGGCEIVEE